LKKKKSFKLNKKDQSYLISAFGFCTVFSFITIIVLKEIYHEKHAEDFGGAISGVLGTYLAFFGSVLVFMALKSQVKANKQVQKQFLKQEKDNLERGKAEALKNKIFIIKDELNNFYYSFNDDSKHNSPKYNFEGAQAIHKLLQTSKDNYYGRKEKNPYELEPKLVELRSLLTFFELTLLSEKRIFSQ
jgi:hypothetical protein